MGPTSAIWVKASSRLFHLRPTEQDPSDARSHSGSTQEGRERSSSQLVLIFLCPVLPCLLSHLPLLMAVRGGGEQLSLTTSMFGRSLPCLFVSQYRSWAVEFNKNFAADSRLSQDFPLFPNCLFTRSSHTAKLRCQGFCLSLVLSPDAIKIPGCHCKNPVRALRSRALLASRWLLSLPTL